MQEHSLNPGDKVGQWEVDRHISIGCIYAVTREDDPETYVMKIRDAHHQRRFEKEIEILKMLNADGGHPSFQTLYDYSHKDFWMVLTYADPDHLISRLGSINMDPEGIIEGLDFATLMDKIVDSIWFALDRGVFLDSGDATLFVVEGRPFWVDIEHATTFEGRTKEQVLAERLALGTPVDVLQRIQFYRQYFL